MLNTVWLTTEETAKLLGITSQETIRNWIETTRFPGSDQTPTGWRFDFNRVLAVKEALEEIRATNARGNLSVPECDSDEDVPLF